jgi:hypothetical protein
VSWLGAEHLGLHEDRMTDDAQDLRITGRCRVVDIGLPHDSTSHARAHVGTHRVVQAFVERRAQSPVGQETFRCATEVTGRTIYTLHAGDDRGATWHDVQQDADEDEEMGLDIVWLLGCRPNHDYDSLCALGDELLPDEGDYQAIIDDDALTFATAIVTEVPALVAQAEAEKGQIVEGILAERIPVRLYRDPDDEAPLLTVAIRTYPMPGTLVLLKDWFERIVLAFFRELPENLSICDEIGGMELRDGEAAFCDFPEA